MTKHHVLYYTVHERQAPFSANGCGGFILSDFCLSLNSFSLYVQSLLQHYKKIDITHHKIIDKRPSVCYNINNFRVETERIADLFAGIEFVFANIFNCLISS